MSGILTSSLREGTGEGSAIGGATAQLSPELVKQLDGMLADADEVLERLHALKAHLGADHALFSRLLSLQLRTSWFRASAYKAGATVNATLDVHKLQPGHRVCLVDRKRLAAGETLEEVQGE
jgi:hypothetical protein